MKVKLLDSTDNIEEKISSYAAICYDSKGANVKRLKADGHFATFRFGYVTFEISEFSRSASMQALRHKFLEFLMRCVSGDTKIKVGTGTNINQYKSVAIKDLYERKYNPYQGHVFNNRIKVLDEVTNTFTNANIVEIFKNGKKELFEVSTTKGDTIRTTKDHKFLTQNGFKRLKDIKVGDYIARNGIPVYQDYTWMKRAKKRSIDSKLGVHGIASEAGCSYHTIRKWLKKLNLSFTKKEVAMYSAPWNTGIIGKESHSFGIKPSLETRKKIGKAKRGSNNPRWNNGATKDRTKVTNYWSSKLNRDKIHDQFCSTCNSTKSLEVDHIQPVATHPDLAYDINNVQLLCKLCHKEKTKTDRQICRETTTWYKVTHIVPSGIEETYDIEVDHPSHNYIANGYVVHNSQRYVKEFKFGYVIPPSIDRNWEARNLFIDAMQHDQDIYDKLIALKIKAEDARYVLPNACHTKFVVTGSVQAWYDFLYGNAGRLQKAAQWEIKEVALEIEKLLKELSPTIFNGQGEN